MAEELDARQGKVLDVGMEQFNCSMRYGDPPIPSAVFTQRALLRHGQSLRAQAACALVRGSRLLVPGA